MCLEQEWDERSKLQDLVVSGFAGVLSVWAQNVQNVVR